MPRVLSAATSLTKDIGEELARLVRKNATSLDLKLCKFGGANRIRNLSTFKKVLPAVVITPELTDHTPVGAQGIMQDMRDEYRITYAFGVLNDTELESEMTRGEKVIKESLTDLLLSEIANDIAPAQVSASYPVRTEWNPEEDDVMAAEDQPVKIIAVVWNVLWLAQG